MSSQDASDIASSTGPTIAVAPAPATGTSNQTERVLTVRHWNESLFSFTTTRPTSFRFESGQFVMLGLPHPAQTPRRAYSVASASYEDHLEFLSIKVPGGALTTELQRLKPGDPVVIGNKPTGTLVLSDLRPGRVLYLLATGTGLAPFLSLVRDPGIYDAFEKIVLVHGTRTLGDLAYRDYLQNILPQHEYLGEAVRRKLEYYPTVTREPFFHQGRITGLIAGNRLTDDLGLPALSPTTDRLMLCGSPAMLADTRALLDARGFRISPGRGVAGDYLVERAFADA